MLGRARPARGCDPALHAARPGQPASGADSGREIREKSGTRIVTGKEKGMDSIEQLISKARETAGGHLSVGRGGCSLHIDDGQTLSGCDIDNMKQLCIDSGLPVIDSRRVPFDTVADLAINGPMVAVGSAPRFFPSRAFSYVSLQEHVAMYRAAGAEIHNMPEACDEPFP